VSLVFCFGLCLLECAITFQLHINEPHYHHEEANAKESDFFADCENEKGSAQSSEWSSHINETVRNVFFFHLNFMICMPIVSHKTKDLISINKIPFFCRLSCL
jgi:phenylacetate-coenzyme A ligase PaaK-like adenylate-forming protein